MGVPYQQFCPVAKAMELLDERWTMLIVRELMAGSRHFNDLRRGLPRISPTLLSKRLSQLCAAGVVSRHPDGAEVHYVLTPAGHELEPIVVALGVWGIRWVGELGDADLDPRLLMWDMHRRVDHTAVPDARTVIHFRFDAAPSRRRDWWMVLTRSDADICDADPGHPVTVAVSSTLSCLTRVWRGDISWSRALRSGDMEIAGPESFRRALPGWFIPSPFAGVARPG